MRKSRRDNAIEQRGRDPERAVGREDSESLDI